ncbi:hypothetical protein T484DRAFT_2241924 [Baffinella frigidus]|nr:hypothetical protein T484DRAFT_2241924 [Cryptophyta sp. CCMP2293]
MSEVPLYMAAVLVVINSAELVVGSMSVRGSLYGRHVSTLTEAMPVKLSRQLSFRYADPRAVTGTREKVTLLKRKVTSMKRARPPGPEAGPSPSPEAGLTHNSRGGPMISPKWS